MKTMCATACLAAFAFLAASSLHAQGTIVVRAAGGTTIQVAPGAKLTIPLVLDMAAAGGLNLASLGSGAQWESARLTLDSIKSASFGTVIPNTSSGSASLAIFDAAGTTTTLTAANFYFTAGTAGSTKLSLSPTAAGSDAGVNLLPRIRVRDLPVCVMNLALWGDVNDDNAVNIIDAQQVARSTVGLSVSSPSAIAALGDVNNDGTVNVVDAQQLARFSVGLTAVARIGTASASLATAATLSVSAVLDAEAGGVNPGVPAITSALTTGKQAQIQVVAHDAGNVDITSCTALTYSSNSTGVATVSSTGLVTAVAAGTATITVGSGPVTTTVSIMVPGTPTSLVVSTQPAGAVTGNNLGTQPVVQVRDGSNAVVASASNTVTATLVGSGGALSGTTTVTAVNGVATFTNLKVTGAGSYQLAFSAAGLSGATSSNFTITSGPPATALAITTQPSGAVSGSNLVTQPVVQVRDGTNALVPSANNAVTATLVGSGGTLSGTTTVSAVNGVATFTNLTVIGNGSYQLLFSATGLSVATSSAFTITPQSIPTKLAIVTAPSSPVANRAVFPQQPAIQLQDASSAPVSLAGVVVTVSGVTGGTATATTNASGVATFENLSVSGAAGPRTIAFTAGGLAGVNATLTVTPGAPTQIVVWAGNNQWAAPSQAVATAPSVFVRDADNNRVPGVALTFAVASGGGSIAGVPTTTNATGYATLGSWTLGPSNGTNTMTVSSSGLGTVTFTATASPGGVLAFQSLAASAYNVCGLSSGSIYCWGRNDYGQIGDGTSGTNTFRARPTRVTVPYSWVSVDAAVTAACGLSTTGSVGCWGAGVGGVVATDYTSLALGDKVACGLKTGGAAYCWGINAGGLIGDGGPQVRTSPVAVVGGVSFQSLALGSGFACGLTSAGAAYCWGSNMYGERGIGGATPIVGPQAVAGGYVFTQIVAGDNHACALSTSGLGYCWGRGWTNRPEPVSYALTFSSLAAGYGTSCGTGANTTNTYCWGSNPGGTLGNGTVGGASGAVSTSLVFTSITIGLGHTCGLVATGAAYCWGQNNGGELGSGANGAAVPTPVAVVSP